MSNLQQRLDEDRAMRDAARRLVEADIGLVHDDSEEHSLTQRVAARVSRESTGLAAQAKDYAKDHPLIVGGGILAIILFIFRNMLLDIAIAFLADDDEGKREQDRDEARSESRDNSAEADRRQTDERPQASGNQGSDRGQSGAGAGS